MPRRSGNRLFTFDELQAVEQMWADGATRAQIADTIGVEIWVLDARRVDQLKHLPAARGRNGGKYNRRRSISDDPTPEEQAEHEQRRLEVQSRWDEETRIARIQGCVTDRTVRVDAIRAAIRHG